MTTETTTLPAERTVLTNSEGGTVQNNTSAGISLVSAALVECQGHLKSASMDATNPFFKSRYATLGAVIEASRDALFNSGLSIQQIPTITGALVSVKTIIRHKSGEWLDGGVMSLEIGENDRNSDAQLAGSILTYLKRYAWATNLGIYSDEDSDGNHAPKGAVKPLGRAGPPVGSTQPVKTSGNPVSDVPEGTLEPPTSAHATTKTRSWAIQKLGADVPGPRRNCLHAYMVALKWIGAGDTVEAWPLEHVPTNGADLQKLLLRLGEFEAEQRAKEP